MRLLLALALIALLPALAAATSCSDATSARVNPAFHSAAAAKWTELSDETEFRRFRVAHVASSVDAYPAGTFSGRGVVVTAASNAEVSSAYVAIQKLRATGNTLPVELFHAGAISEAAQAEFEAVTGVTVHSVPATEDAALVPTALKQSSFEEVLLLSPRTHALADPASVFETAEYARTGLLLWPSLHKTAPANPIWAILGQECVDAYEQSSAAAVVNKQKAWAALNVAAHFRGSFYQSMVNGDDSILALGALATATEAHVAPASQAVGAHYTIAGARQFCAHSTVLAAPTAAASPLFMHTAGNEVAMSGSQGETLTCLQNAGEAAPHDEQAVSELVRLQASVPANSHKIALQACGTGVPSEEVYNTLVGPTGRFYDYNRFVPEKQGEANALIVNGPDYSQYVTYCGKFFSGCGAADGSSEMDIPMFFFNLTARPGKSANVRVYTPTIQGQAGRPVGNNTLLRVVDNGQRRDECDYGGRSGPSYVYHNIVKGGYAIIAVAWRAGVQPANYPIQVVVVYNGDSNAASTAAGASLSVVAAAVLAAVVARFL